MGFGNTQFPWNSRVFDRGQRRCPGSSIVSANDNHIGMSFGHACGNRPHSSFGNQFDCDPCFRIGIFQVEDQLGQILDRIDIVVWRRGNQGYARCRIAHFSNIPAYFITRQLSSFTRFCSLSDFDLQFVAVDQIFRGHPKAS